MDVYIWLGLMGLFLLIEAACPVHLVSLWFAVGALVAAILAALGISVAWQIPVFIAVSGILLAALWPVTKKLLTPRITPTNVDSIIGTCGYVTQSIDNLCAIGQVKLGGMEWSARSADGTPIQVGTLVKVERIEGVKVIVIPAEVKV